MKTALIIGGTGLVGKELTSLLLEDNRYDRVVLLLRSPLERVHEKLVQVEYNFNEPDHSLVKGDELFCCLGTTIKAAGSKAAFFKVDHDYIIQTATTAFQNGIKKMAMVSSLGANKRSRFFYNKTKGETEESARQVGFQNLYIFRPSLLLGERPVKRAGEMFATFLVKNISFLVPGKYKAIHGRQVAKAMIDYMNSNRAGVCIVESDSMQLY